MSKIHSILRLTSLLLWLCLLLSSCKDDKDKVIVPLGNVTVTTTERPLRCDYTEYKYVAMAHCTGRGWRATCSSDWVTLSLTQGTDSDYIHIYVDENEELTKRYAVIRFYDIDDPNTLSDYVEIIQQKFSPEIGSVLTESLSRKHRLGYGYDIFGSFVNDQSFSQKPVLDYDFMLLMEQTHGRQMVTEDLRHNEVLEIISANTLTELRSELTEAENSKGFMGCGKYTSTENEVFKNKTIDQECGVIRLKQIVSSRTIDLGAVYAVLHDGIINQPELLYSPEFRSAIDAVKTNLGNPTQLEQSLSALYTNFGSHFVLSADLGGEIRLNTIIDRETSIEKTHSVTAISKKIFGKRVSGTTSVYEKYSKDEKLRYQIDMTITGGTDDIKEQLKGKVKNFDINDPITDSEIIEWQNTIQFPTDGNSEEYNAALVDCRLIPLYELIADEEVADAYQSYLEKLNATQKPSESDLEDPVSCSLATFAPATSESEAEALYAQCIKYGSKLRAVISSEYIPTIRSDRPCLVAYPIVAGRPFMYAGVFVGDKEHLPGIVRWLGNNCLYEPNEAFDSDSLGYKELLDEKGQLKQLYLYWGAVQMVPNEQIHCAPNTTISQAQMKLPNNGTSPVIKVGPYYWSQSSNAISGVSNRSYENGLYSTVGTDPDAWMKSDYTWRNLLPKSIQAQSVMSILNGRAEIMEKPYYTKTGANLLGLRWTKGYLAVSGSNLYPCDMNSWLVPVCEGDRLYVTRLSLSGHATTLNLGDYIQSVGYLDSQYEKFLPYYFCTDEVY